MYFEEFTPGLGLATALRLISPQDIDAFIQLSGLANPIFMSDDGARAAGHQARLVPAPLQLSLAMGLCQQAGFFDHVAAVLEFDRMKFLGPVHPGQSLRLEAEVLEARPTARPDRGLVILGYTLKNQDQQVVMTAKAVYLMRRRPDPT
jgi:acyl dehydratase